MKYLQTTNKDNSDRLRWNYYFKVNSDLFLYTAYDRIEIQLYIKLSDALSDKMDKKLRVINRSFH